MLLFIAAFPRLHYSSSPTSSCPTLIQPIAGPGSDSQVPAGNTLPASGFRSRSSSLNHTARAGFGSHRSLRNEAEPQPHGVSRRLQPSHSGGEQPSWHLVLYRGRGRGVPGTCSLIEGLGDCCRTPIGRCRLAIALGRAAYRSDGNSAREARRADPDFRKSP